MNKMTPLYYLECNDNNIFIKREDLIPFSFGGNKARKAIYFFKEIDIGNYDAIVTYGSSSSNHCRVVANMAAARRLPCFIISPLENTIQTFNRKMMQLFGAEIINVPVKDVHNTIEMYLQKLKNLGKKPYFIAGGGHGNLGTQAYVDCYEEILDYEKQSNLIFDYIFFASGTGTTQAGLICGQLMHRGRHEIIGISIARKVQNGKPVIIKSVHEYLDAHGKSFKNDKIEKSTVFIDDYTAKGYGQESNEIQRTINEMILKYGIPMDAVYTAKAYSGMLNYLKVRGIREKNVLFVHTGGTPLFFDALMKK